MGVGRGLRAGLLLWGTAAGFALCTGCGTQPGAGITNADRSGRFAEAVQLYQNGCNSCHGNDLEGGVGPSLAHVGSKLSEAEIARRIAEGGGPMPAYGPGGQAILSPSQINLLAAWLATKK
ncbi:c-type cytochrome [Alicyclobacillus macrosporangiidus]|jgi:cytochrome c551|uniref:Cytochrome c551 n=1 Tax=Alicyclobacillus macrosporangiidus TaxID=392015 RepID=A0A1I7L759_9BACL|nr:cytochrome c [Alicyclobacillus macrosporangiidus]SFV05632.1 cytochrome c551 [Alicyclobacillus macrosporangiidus]